MDGQDDLRRLIREIGVEFTQAVEQAGRLARAAAADIAGYARREAPAPGAPHPAESAPPADVIRQLGELRDAGYISDAEFQAKKSELLGRI